MPISRAIVRLTGGRACQCALACGPPPVPDRELGEGAPRRSHPVSSTAWRESAKLPHDVKDRALLLWPVDDPVGAEPSREVPSREVPDQLAPEQRAQATWLLTTVQRR